MDSKEEPTVLSAIILSDHAIREAGTNKLTLIGIFSNWNLPSFPFKTPPFYITPFITNLRRAGERALSVRIESVKERIVVLGFGGKFGIPANIPANAIIDTPIPIIQGMILPQAGTYRIYVLIDGEEIGSRDFEVVAITGNPLNPGQIVGQ